MLMIKALSKNLVEVKECQNNKSQVFWLPIQKNPQESSVDSHFSGPAM